MKIFKRNAVIITVLMFVCVAVYLNWSYNNRETVDPVAGPGIRTDANGGEDPAEGDGTDETAGGDDMQNIDASDSGLFYSGTFGDEIGSGAVSDYFASARLTRKHARDSAVSILHETADAENASQEVRDNALNTITAMAGYSITEAQIENLIVAKGFADCVAFIGNEGISVVVASPEEGLDSAAVAKIMDIVLSETGMRADQIKVIEVK